MSAHDQTIASMVPLADLIAIADQARRQAPHYPDQWRFRIPRRPDYRPDFTRPSLLPDPADMLFCFEGTLKHHPVERRSIPGGVRHTRHYYEFNGCLL